MLPNFVFCAMGIFNIPTSLLASVALHLDGTIVLFQYLLGHRGHADSCPQCEKPWHPDVTDVFHRPYSARVGQWWRRSFIDSRSFITVTVIPEPPASSHAGGPAKFSTTALQYANEEKDDSNEGWVSSQSVQHTIRTTQLPSMVYDLPNLSIRVQQDRHSGITTSQSSSTNGSETSLVTTRNPFRSLLKWSLSPKALRTPSEPPAHPPVARSSLVRRVVSTDTLDEPKFPSVEAESVQSIRTADEISRIPPRPPRPSRPQSSFSAALPPSPRSSKQSSRKSSRGAILENFPPLPTPPLRVPPPDTRDLMMMNSDRYLSRRSTTPISTTPRPSILVASEGIRTFANNALSKSSESSLQREKAAQSSLSAAPFAVGQSEFRPPEISARPRGNEKIRRGNASDLTSSGSQPSDTSQRSKVFVPRREGML